MRAFLIIFVVLVSGCAVVRSPSLQPFSDATEWVVRSEMQYEIGTTGKYITVPEGFVTDFASVPSSLRPIFPKLGKYLFAAIVHDYLYWNQSCTKKQADEIFYLAMIESGVGWFDRAAFFQAVDKVGKSAWRENKKKKSDGYVKVIPSSHLHFRPSMTWGEYVEILKRDGVEDADPAVDLGNTCDAINAYI